MMAGSGRDVAAGDEPAPVMTIVGEKVSLGPLRRDLIPVYQRWMNDPVTLRAYDTLRPLTLEQVADWYDRQMQASDMVRFTVYERVTGQPIGKTALYDLDFRNRCAEFGILIGEASARGKGYGTEATQLMLDYAFTALGLHNVRLEALAFNEPALRAYRKAGFKEFGRRREVYWMGGRWWDEVYMDCLSTEFTSPVLGKIYVPETTR